MPLPIILGFLGAIVGDILVFEGKITGNAILRMRRGINNIGNAANMDLPVDYQTSQLVRECEAKGISVEKCQALAHTILDKLESSKLVGAAADMTRTLASGLNAEAKAVAGSAFEEIANAMNEMQRMNQLPGPVSGITGQIAGPQAVSFGSPALSWQSATDSLTRPGDILLEDLKSGNYTNPYAHAFSPATHERFNRVMDAGLDLVGDVWAVLTDIPKLLHWFLQDGWMYAAGIFVAYKFYQVYKSKSISDVEFQQRVEVTKRLSDKASSQSTSNSVVKTTSVGKLVTKKPSDKSSVRKVTYTERGEEIKIPDEDDMLDKDSVDDESDYETDVFANTPKEVTPQFQKASLVVDAFVTIFVSRALFFAIPEDPPQSIWSYVKSYFKPQSSHLLHMVFTEPEDADKHNPISRCFYSANYWSSEQRKRYGYLLDLTQRHVSVGVKVKAVLDNEEYPAGTLLAYIASHRKAIVSQGFYETLATFPFFLREFFGDQLEKYADAIRKRDEAILANRPIVEKPELPERLWNNRDIDLLFLLDERFPNKPNPWMTNQLSRNELYEFAKKPRLLQDYLFGVRMINGISSRLAVKTGEHTVVVYKPGGVNPSIWGIMEKNNPNHYERHLKAAFLLAAADLENDMMEEHFCWKNGPFKRHMEQEHKKKYRRWQNTFPSIELRSVLDAKWFEEVNWFSGVAGAASETEAVKLLINKPPSQFSKLQADGNRIHCMLGAREVTITVTNNYMARTAFNLMKLMGQFSFGRVPHLDTFIYGQFDIGEWAVVIHYHRSKSLAKNVGYATDRALCDAILAIGEVHRYNYCVSPDKNSIRVDPGTNTVFLELFNAADAYVSPDFEFRKFLKAWLSIEPEHELAKKLLECEDILESVKGCTLVSHLDTEAGPFYESETGLHQLNVWLTALQTMHNKGFYGFITPKLLDSGNLQENKTPQAEGIPPNIDHRGLIKKSEWSIHLDCKMLLQSIMLLTKYREYGTWSEVVPLADFDLVNTGCNTRDLTTSLLLDCVLLTRKFLRDKFLLRRYLGASIQRETLWSFRVLTQPYNCFYDLQEEVVYKKKRNGELEKITTMSELRTCKLKSNEWQDKWLRK